jgi:hypothetical protein
VPCRGEAAAFPRGDISTAVSTDNSRGKFGPQYNDPDEVVAKYSLGESVGGDNKLDDVDTG